jgi:hypothetical protein
MVSRTLIGLALVARVISFVFDALAVGLEVLAMRVRRR